MKTLHACVLAQTCLAGWRVSLGMQNKGFKEYGDMPLFRWSWEISLVISLLIAFIVLDVCSFLNL